MLSHIWSYFREDGIASLIISVLIILPIIGGIPYQATISIYFGFLLSILYSYDGRATINTQLFVLIVYLAINLLITRPDPVFRSWQRYLTFSTMLFALSPIIISEKRRFMCMMILRTCLMLCVIISSICFFCYFLNINYFEDRYLGGYLEDYATNLGHFSGITRHSMMLGPIAGLASIFLIYNIIYHKKYKLLVLLPLCLGSVFFAASRGALFSTLAGFIFVIIRSTLLKNRNYIVIICFIALFVITSPFIRQQTYNVVHKHDMVETGLFSSRSTKYIARIQEFLSSPILGVGFSSIDPNGQDTYDISSGSIEPGSSWLAVLSMTGLIGMILVIRIVTSSIKKAIDLRNDLVCACLIFFIIHFIVEGYIFSAGNSLAALFWLVIACCDFCTVESDTYSRNI